MKAFTLAEMSKKTETNILMHLRSLYLHHFRPYEEAFFEFSPKINAIVGPNARGKTSLLEAIYFLITGRSFRTARTSDMIRHGASAFYIEASFEKHGVEQKMEVSCNGKERKIIYNHTVYASSSDVLGVLQGTVIHPDDVSIVKGSPDVRRRLLDLHIAQVNPLYVRYLTRYHGAMRQRNQLLKTRNLASIDSWELQMAQMAAYIVQQRMLTIQSLQEEGRRLYHMITSGAEEFALAYKAYAISGSLQEICPKSLPLHYLQHYQRLRVREMELGATLIGPHKDDLQIFLGENEARFFASEGQQRSCIIALRLAEWMLLKNGTLEVPLMLIDDLGISLDESRRTRLFDYLATFDQVFLTTTHQNNDAQPKAVAWKHFFP